MTGGAYGQRTEPRRRQWSPTDRRYSSYRWRVRTRLPVLGRDGWRCWVHGCDRYANVCDHIRAVYPGMPDRGFFDPKNLRASCRAHNLARGYTGPDFEAQFGMVDRRSPLASSGVVTRDYTRRSRAR